MNRVSLYPNNKANNKASNKDNNNQSNPLNQSNLAKPCNKPNQVLKKQKRKLR